jgi:hypothetical protein
MGYGLKVIGYRLWKGLGFRVKGSRFRVYNSGFRDIRYRV